MEKPKRFIHWSNAYPFETAGVVHVGRAVIPVRLLLIVAGVVNGLALVVGFLWDFVWGGLASATPDTPPPGVSLLMTVAGVSALVGFFGFVIPMSVVALRKLFASMQEYSREGH